MRRVETRPTRTINANQIATREIQLLIPGTPSAVENQAILDAIAYSESQGVKMIVTVGVP